MGGGGRGVALDAWAEGYCAREFFESAGGMEFFMQVESESGTWYAGAVETQARCYNSGVVLLVLRLRGMHVYEVVNH